MPLARSAKILVRSTSAQTLQEVATLLERAPERAKEDADRSRRYFSYTAKNFKAVEVKERLLRYFSQAEAKEIHVVLPRSSNALWIRASPRLLERVRKVLPAADSRKMRPPGATDTRRRPDTRDDRRGTRPRQTGRVVRDAPPSAGG